MKFFAALGVIFLVLLIVGFVAFCYAAYTGNQLDASSKLYVDENTPAIISHWSGQELVKRASPELMGKTTNGQIDQFFLLLDSKLGSFKSYDGATGSANMNWKLGQAEEITAKYVAHATYEYGKADVDIALIQKDGGWEYLGFHVQMHK